MSGGALQGIRVLDLTSVVMGPVATQFFADYGADVVKIEPPEGDLLRTLGGKSVTPKMASKFLHMNRNKRSVVLDLKQPAARGALKRLCTGADVLVVNMRAAALKRLGLGYDELRAANGKLVYCSLVGFGQSGRYAAKPAYDTIIQGSAGVAACHASFHSHTARKPHWFASGEPPEPRTGPNSRGPINHSVLNNRSQPAASRRSSSHSAKT